MDLDNCDTAYLNAVRLISLFKDNNLPIPNFEKNNFWAIKLSLSNIKYYVEVTDEYYLVAKYDKSKNKFIYKDLAYPQEVINDLKQYL